MTNMVDFEDKKSSNDVINNDTISDDEVVASYVPPRYLFFLFLASQSHRVRSENKTRAIDVETLGVSLPASN